MLGSFGGPLLEPQYVGSFLLLALVSMIAAGALLGLDIPTAKAEVGDASRSRAWRTIVRQPAYLVALFGAATGYGVMILAMTATPLAMVHHHHDLATAATVIQLHVLGMFLPSFVTGSLIARFGVLRIMLTGVALLAGHVLLTLTNHGFSSFASALILLGVGWNFLYIGGTTLLISTYTAAEKGRAGDQRHDHLRCRPRLLLQCRGSAQSLRLANAQRAAAAVAGDRRDGAALARLATTPRGRACSRGIRTSDESHPGLLS